MFKLDDNPTFKRVVDVMVPTDGGHEKQTLNATFQVCPVDEFGKFDLQTTSGSTAMLRRVVVELGDIIGGDGHPLPWSDAVRDRLFALNYVRAGLTRAYFMAVNKAAEGN